MKYHEFFKKLNEYDADTADLVRGFTESEAIRFLRKHYRLMPLKWSDSVVKEKILFQAKQKYCFKKVL